MGYTFRPLSDLTEGSSTEDDGIETDHGSEEDTDADSSHVIKT